MPSFLNHLNIVFFQTLLYIVHYVFHFTIVFPRIFHSIKQDILYIRPSTYIHFPGIHIPAASLASSAGFNTATVAITQATGLSASRPMSQHINHTIIKIFIQSNTILDASRHITRDHVTTQKVHSDLQVNTKRLLMFKFESFEVVIKCNNFSLKQCNCNEIYFVSSHNYFPTQLEYIEKF